MVCLLWSEMALIILFGGYMGIYFGCNIIPRMVRPHKNKSGRFTKEYIKELVTNAAGDPFVDVICSTRGKTACMLL